MAWLFSKRCKQALKEKKIKVSIPISVRVRLLKAMQNRNMVYWETTETGFNYQTATLNDLPERIQTEIGCNLPAFPESGEGPAKPSNLEGFILRGNYPPYLFDTLELFYLMLDDQNKNLFQSDFNQIMEESDLRWRMAEGKIFPVDSTYIEEEIIRRSYKLLQEAKFQGALQEFEKARIDLSNGDLEGAI